MSKLKRVGALDVSEDVRFTKGSWIVERVGWILLGLFILSAAAGLTGPGPLSGVAKGTGLKIEYERFVHRESRTVLRATIPVRENRAELWLQRDYVRAMEVEGVQPEPLEVRTDGDYHRYVFAAEAGASEVTVTFDVLFRKAGRITGRIAAPGTDPLSAGHLVYP